MWFHAPRATGVRGRVAATLRRRDAEPNRPRRAHERRFRADEWMLYDATSPRLVDSRGLAFGSLFQEGRLCVSVAQEGLLRLARTKTA